MDYTDNIKQVNLITPSNISLYIKREIEIDRYSVDIHIYINICFCVYIYVYISYILVISFKFF